MLYVHMQVLWLEVKPSALVSLASGFSRNPGNVVVERREKYIKGTNQIVELVLWFDVVLSRINMSGCVLSWCVLCGFECTSLPQPPLMEGLFKTKLKGMRGELWYANTHPNLNIHTTLNIIPLLNLHPILSLYLFIDLFKSIWIKIRPFAVVRPLFSLSYVWKIGKTKNQKNQKQSWK